MSESLQGLVRCQPTPGGGWFSQLQVNRSPTTSSSVIESARIFSMHISDDRFSPMFAILRPCRLHKSLAADLANMILKEKSEIYFFANQEPSDQDVALYGRTTGASA